MESKDLRRERYGNMMKIRTGGLMFYICAFATVFNVLLTYINFKVIMPVGLKTVQYWFVDHVTDLNMSIWLGVMISVLIAAVYAVLGYFAREKRNYVCYTIGLLLYLMDLIRLFAPGSLLESVLGNSGNILGMYDNALVVMFDIYAAILIFMGFRAFRKVGEIDKKVKEEGLSPIPDNDDPTTGMTLEEKKAYQKQTRKNSLIPIRRKESDEQKVVTIDPAAAWPEPEKDRKKAKSERIAREDAEAALEAEKEKEISE